MQTELYVLILVDEQSPDVMPTLLHAHTSESIHGCLHHFCGREYEPSVVPLFVKWTLLRGIQVNRMDSFSPYKDWYSTGRNESERNRVQCLALAAVAKYFNGSKRLS